jgi:hypothetical protein
MAKHPSVLYLTSGNGRVKYDYGTGLITLTLYGTLDQATGTRKWPWEEAPASLRLAIHREALNRARIENRTNHD